MRSPHSGMQAAPATIEEVRRILLAHSERSACPHAGGLSGAIPLLRGALRRRRLRGRPSETSFATTFWPGRAFCTPSTITRSPAASPSTICCMPSCAAPSATRRYSTVSSAFTTST